LLTAYAVVPEVYRKRFRNLNKHHSETFSEFAFRLGVQFRRWLPEGDRLPEGWPKQAAVGPRGSGGTLKIRYSAGEWLKAPVSSES